MLETVWAHLSRGVADQEHPARHPTLATMGDAGPEVRTLVLRGVDRGQSTLEFHTDSASPKAAQIGTDPRVAIHVWVPKARLQIRARGLAEVLDGSDDLFERLPPEAQANYTGAVPGSVLPAPDPGDGPRFARILCTLSEIDALVLFDPHRRAVFAASDAWQGQWIAP